MSAYTDRLARKWQQGYAEAMTDLLDAYDRTGLEGLAQWMADNASNNDTSDRARAARLLADLQRAMDEDGDADE